MTISNAHRPEEPNKSFCKVSTFTETITVSPRLPLGFGATVRNTCVGVMRSSSDSTWGRKRYWPVERWRRGLREAWATDFQGANQVHGVGGIKAIPSTNEARVTW